MPTFRSGALILALLASLPLAPVNADTALPPLLVSAIRSEQGNIETPASITLITQQEISKYQPRNLFELLRSRGGLQIDELSGNGESATIDMRGFGPAASSNTLILMDGRRLNNSSDRASPDLNSIYLHNVERIEIIQGSAGTLFGNQAVGGVINIISRRPEQLQARISAGAGNYAGYRLHADLGDQLTDGLSYRISGNKSDNDNYRDNNGSNRKELSMRVDFDHQTGSLFFDHQYLDDFQELPGSLFTDELAIDRRQSVDAYQGDFSHSRSHTSRLGLHQDLTHHWSFEGELCYRDNARDFQTSFRTFPGSEATQERKVLGLNPRFIGVYPLTSGKLLITTGADFERTDYELQTAFGAQLLDQEIDAYYGQLVFPIRQKWSVTAGIRHAEIENKIASEDPDVRLDDSISIGSLGTVYRPDPAWRLFLRADQNYRFATVDEHTNVIFGESVGINNQTGISYETGVEWSTPEAQAKLVIYRLDLEHEISFDASGFINTNLDETRRQGMILEGRWSVIPRLSLGGSFTYTDPQITAGPFEGNRIPLVSSRSVRLFSDWDISYRLALLTELLYSSERVLGGDFDNRFPTLDGYAILNTAFSYQAAPWGLNLKINNLLEKEYASSGSVGFDDTFISQDAYFPAAERNFWLSLEYSFI